MGPLEDCGLDVALEVNPSVLAYLAALNLTAQLWPAALVLRTPRYPTAHANETVDLAPSGGTRARRAVAFYSAPTY